MRIKITFKTALLLICISASFMQAVRAADVPDKKESFKLPPIILPVPQSEAEKNYLGLTGTGKCKIGDIKTQVVLIEIFSYYCPHCRNTAPIVNDLYKLIENRPELKNKIKIIGIGAGNNKKDIDAFREKFHIQYTLFADDDESLSNLLGAEVTPTFIGIKLKEKENHALILFQEGEIDNAQSFLDQIIKAAKKE